MFWHRLLNRHIWVTVSERDVSGRKGGGEFKGFLTNSAMRWIEKIMNGYTVIHQRCPACGDRKTIHRW